MKRSNAVEPYADMSTWPEPCVWGIAAAKRALSDGRISPAEYRQALTARAMETQELNCVSVLLPSVGSYQGSLKRHFPHEPLGDVPIVVKDSIDVSGVATTAGTRGLSEAIARRDASAVSALRTAGAHLLAKTTMHELSYGITGNNSWSGATRNPWNLRLIAGGSSGGSAAAVAAGIAPAALGADTGGSVRIPASLCGVVGYRPTTGRYASDGVVPLCPSRDTLGIIARDVEDVILVDSLLRQVDGTDVMCEHSVGVPMEFLQDLDDSVARAADEFLTVLEGHGVVVRPIKISEILDQVGSASATIVHAEWIPGLNRYLSHGQHRVSVDQIGREIASPDVQKLWGAASKDGGRVWKEGYLSAAAAVNVAGANLNRVMRRENVGFLAYPTTPLSARPVGQDRRIQLNGHAVGTFGAYVRHTDLAAALGLPALSIPTKFRTLPGLPVGMEIASWRGSDQSVLRLGRRSQRWMRSGSECC